MATDQPPQIHRGKAENDKISNDNAGHSGQLEEPGKKDLPKPFPGKPWLAGFGEGKEIGSGKLVVVENPFARAEVPPCIGVDEHAGDAAHQTKQQYGGGQEY